MKNKYLENTCHKPKAQRNKDTSDSIEHEQLSDHMANKDKNKTLLNCKSRDSSNT